MPLPVLAEYADQVFPMDNRAQVSIEYLLLALFGVSLAAIAAMVIDGISSVAQSAQGRILSYRHQTIASLLQT